MSKLELLEEKMRYELFLLDIIRKYCIDDEIVFTEEMAYYDTGTISGVENYKVYISADGLDVEPIEFDLAELMQISSIGELIEEKIKCEK